MRWMLLLLAVPSIALADIPPPQPLSPTLRGQDSVFTAGDVPDHAMFTTHNPTGNPITLAVRGIHYGTVDGVSLPISGVEVDGHRVSGTVTVASGRTIHIVVFFGGVPIADRTQGRFSFTLAATLAGRATTASATVSRAIREPIRRDIVITS